MLRSRSMLRTLLIGTLIATSGACEDKVADRTEHAAARVTKAADHLRHERRELSAETRADGRVALGKAQLDYEHLKALRVASLRAAHSVAASQPLLIITISAEKTLTPALRARLDDNLRIFRQRLAATRTAIEELAFVTAAEWERRDDDLRRQMAGLDLARAASWELLDDDHREPRFPRT
jgi:hypothetical protein